MCDEASGALDLGLIFLIYFFINSYVVRVQKTHNSGACCLANFECGITRWVGRHYGTEVITIPKVQLNHERDGGQDNKHILISGLALLYVRYWYETANYEPLGLEDVL